MLNTPTTRCILYSLGGFMNKLQILSQNLTKLNARDLSFAQSLLKQSTRGLSDKQMYWVGVLADRVTEPAPVLDEVAAPLQVKEIFSLIERNNMAKRPKLRVIIGQQEMQVSRAGDRARFPGSLNVVQINGKVFLGRVHLDGRWEPARYIEPNRAKEIGEGLKLFAANPEETARAYGKQTGHCCFCAKHLDDERSLLMGYGPVCAANYRLPWGERKAA